MVVFLDPVTLLQALGYSIALAGLVYYKLGAEKLKVYFEAHQFCKDYGWRHPLVRLAIYVCLIFVVLFAVFHTGASSNISSMYGKFAGES
jgi:hypothetical protein